MNRILALALVILTSLPGSRAFAQSITYHFTADNEDITTNVPLNEISTRAFRNFVKTYGFVSAAIWRKAEPGYTVRWFSADSVEYLVHYTQRGALSDTHIYYTRLNAPPEIRTQMGRLYPAYDLLFVNELEESDHPLYEVGLAYNGLMLIVDVKDKEVRAEQNFGTVSLK
jgi:hypothetical protein